MDVHVSFKGGLVGSIEIDEQWVIDQMEPSIRAGFEAVATTVVDVAKQRCPVGKERPFHPRASSFEPIRLREEGSMGRPGSSDDVSRLMDLHGYTQTRSGRKVGLPGLVERVSQSDVKFFVGAKGGPNEDRSPDKLHVGRTVKGAFKHRPGTLKASIHFVGTKREGNTITGTVVADAPYAYWVAAGHKTRGDTSTAANTFLKSAIEVDAREQLFNPSTYKG
jgi:hypothetical protein